MINWEHRFRVRSFRTATCLYGASLTVVAASLLFGSAASGLAFGPTGHRVVGRIGERHLTPHAVEAIRAIMGDESLAEAATWPDEIRSDPEFDHTQPWHFVTIEDGETYESSSKNPQGDAIEAIERFTIVLRDPNAKRSERMNAIRWIVHLIGDVHQPLHVGRGADRGGNTIDVVWFGEETNLHVVWDEGLIESTKLSFSELADFINTDSAADIATWQQSTVREWARESVALRSRVYEVPDPPRPGRPKDKSGSYRYAYKNVPLIKKRMLQAGVRLAGHLNAIFAAPAPPLDE